MDSSSESPLVCSNCFNDHGLKLDAERMGVESIDPCPNCGSKNSKQLTNTGLATLTHRYFVWGSLRRAKYGAAPLFQFNEYRKTEVNFNPWLEPDVRLVERLLGIGFFDYGPRLWMLGEIQPLKALELVKKRPSIISRILQEYPERILTGTDSFYRIRVNPDNPSNKNQYDSRPPEIKGNGRLDFKGEAILYGSADLETCIHECRVSAEDDIFVATLCPSNKLRLLDLSVLLPEAEGVTEFESLDLAVHMLFLAGRHTYKITKAIAKSVYAAGFDGLVYPSYFSLLRLGNMPFQTIYGISQRRVAQLQAHEQSKTVPNIALFGRPVTTGAIEVVSIDRLILSRVGYEYHFGPSCF